MGEDPRSPVSCWLLMPRHRVWLRKSASRRGLPPAGPQVTDLTSQSSRRSLSCLPPTLAATL